MTHRIDKATMQIRRAIEERARRRDGFVLVALDGRSGSGKSTLAAAVAREMDAACVPADDFFSAHITTAGWDARSPAQRAADAIDWRRLRDEALVPLISGRGAAWRAFDFAAGPRADGTYGMSDCVIVREPRPVILLDGAYSTRPELADLIALSVLVRAPLAICHQRLAGREEAAFLAAWHARWDAAEDWYFTHLRPESAFDLVVNND